MIKQIEIKILPKDINDESLIRNAIERKLRQKINSKHSFHLRKKSIDARGATPFFLLRYDVYINEKPAEEIPYLAALKPIEGNRKVVVVGAGPAGYFAALTLLQQGIKPIVLDRGKDVQRRRRDLKAIQQEGIVHPHSNYCFGEGGAGTYSDGKLYTRSQKRGKIIDVLKILVEHGAPTEILTDAHPHIGSNKLPKIVSAIRETIESLGGEVHFDTYVNDFIIEKGLIKAVVSAEGTVFSGEAVILATGHSARDIYFLLDKKGIHIEKKPFALGVRIEHPQSLIDYIQYRQNPREENLPASSYRLACQVSGKGVFSFCMCPGGLIVPSATAPKELVVNGMSLSRRDSPYSNSGLVTAIDEDEMAGRGYDDLWGHLRFQQEVEQKLWNFGDGSQKAPAQRITDFVKAKVSSDLPDSSYIPGIYTAPMHELLPAFVVERLQKALIVFGKKMKGYFTEEAQIIGVESRTSSPIKVPREKDTFMHKDVSGLFPCGEGAGYAGGILSAAMDGQNVAKAVGEYLK